VTGKGTAAVCAFVVALSLDACTANAHRPRSSGPLSSTTAPQQTVLGAPGCTPPTPIASSPLGPEIEGNGHGATLYGLIMAPTNPVRNGEDVKIVWRMTGSGPLRLTTTSPQGATVPLQWGPELHGASNFDRPGEEWGAGYRFAIAGCWHLHAQRSVGSADVWLYVQSK
jgi:hypothetical protein